MKSVVGGLEPFKIVAEIVDGNRNYELRRIDLELLSPTDD